MRKLTAKLLASFAALTLVTSVSVSQAQVGPHNLSGPDYYESWDGDVQYVYYTSMYGSQTIITDYGTTPFTAIFSGGWTDNYNNTGGYSGYYDHTYNSWVVTNENYVTYGGAGTTAFGILNYGAYKTTVGIVNGVTVSTEIELTYSNPLTGGGGAGTYESGSYSANYSGPELLGSAPTLFGLSWSYSSASYTEAGSAPNALTESTSDEYYTSGSYFVTYSTDMDIYGTVYTVFGSHPHYGSFGGNDGTDYPTDFNFSPATSLGTTTLWFDGNPEYWSTSTLDSSGVGVSQYGIWTITDDGAGNLEVTDGTNTYYGTVTVTLGVPDFDVTGLSIEPTEP